MSPVDFRDPITKFLADKTLTIPLGEALLLLSLLMFCLLFQRHKLGLLIAYSFVFYWGFIFNLDYFTNILTGNSAGLYGFFFFGFSIVVLALIGFFQKEND